MNIEELRVEFIASFQLFFFGTVAFVFSEQHPEFAPLTVGFIFGIKAYIGSAV
ncbi:MAG: hypothetical protein P8M61_04095 [Crocinitomicaceae bacterium]|nr:hypothetical protein [Crocinitomicaceae bacterium]MDG2464246.1 hypothetical protein [Crocinitomicaceae bacterium]